MIIPMSLLEPADDYYNGHTYLVAIPHSPHFLSVNPLFQLLLQIGCTLLQSFTKMQGNVNNKLIYHLWILIPLWGLQLLTEILVIVLNGSGLTYVIMAFSVPFCHTDDLGDRYCGPRYYDPIDIVVYA